MTLVLKPTFETFIGVDVDYI